MFFALFVPDSHSTWLQNAVFTGFTSWLRAKLPAATEASRRPNQQTRRCDVMSAMTCNANPKKNNKTNFSKTSNKQHLQEWSASPKNARNTKNYERVMITVRQEFPITVDATMLQCLLSRALLRGFSFHICFVKAYVCQQDACVRTSFPGLGVHLDQLSI